MGKLLGIGGLSWTLVLLGACGGAASEPDAAGDPPGLGTAKEVGSDCGGVSALPDTTCHQLEVQCPDFLTAKVAIVRVSAPTSTSKGVVLFGSSGGGVTFYEDKAVDLLGSIQSASFTVVQHMWQGNGWMDGDNGPILTSCHYATLVSWIRDELLVPEMAFCALGHGSGADEIAYGLAHWDRDIVLDLAVMTGGPAMARLDIGCTGDIAHPLVQECVSQSRPVEHTCSPLSCKSPASLIDANYTGTPCASLDQELLRRDSVVTIGADISYPDTATRFVFGAQDCSHGPGLGYYYYNTLASIPGNDVELVFAAQTPHEVHTTDPGQALLKDLISQQCVFRH